MSKKSNQRAAGQEGRQSATGASSNKSSTDENQVYDDSQQTMTSHSQQQQQPRKRPRMGQQAGETTNITSGANANAQSEQLAVERKIDRLLERQELVGFARGEAVQELRVSMRHQRPPASKHQPDPELQRPPTNPPQPLQQPNEEQQQQQQQPNQPAPQNQTPPQQQQRKRDPTTAAAATVPPRKATTSPALVGPSAGGQANQNQNQSQNICAACLKPIRERYLLMALDKHWHEDCLKCACCDCRLGEVGSSLFTHSDKILCRRDFLRIFGQHGHCAACKRSIPPYEMVMRANDFAYHMDCFACQQCQYRFCVGDRFHLTETHKIICLLCHTDQQQQQLNQQQQLQDSSQLPVAVPATGASPSLEPVGDGDQLEQVAAGRQQQQQHGKLARLRLAANLASAGSGLNTHKSQSRSQDGELLASSQVEAGGDHDDDDQEDDQDDDEVTSSAATSAPAGNACPLPAAHQANKQKQACAV